MQQVIIEKPYTFIPPQRNALWGWAIQKLGLIDHYLWRCEGIQSYELRGVDHFRESLRRGHGILLTPNHCRYSDPVIMGWVAKAGETSIYAMASWHLFHKSWLVRWALTTLGAFSVYREGVDRQSLDLAVDILSTAERPLVIFPEGTIYRTNDRLQALLDGVAFIARTAAKKRAKIDPNKRVVLHPIAIKYVFRGDLRKTLESVVATIEHRLTWNTPAPPSLLARVKRAVLGILALKEIEHLGSAQQGAFAERQKVLIDHLLFPLEDEWLGRRQEGDIIPRIKAIRTKILPEMTSGTLDSLERERRWKQLANIYLSQQIASYPVDYLDAPTTESRILETVERLEEDLTDKVRLHRPFHAIIEVCEAIEVPLDRGPRGEEDPLMKQLRSVLQSKLDALSKESRDFVE